MSDLYYGTYDIFEIRQEVIKASGRWDLVSFDAGDYCDNGIDFFIHQGQRALERRLNIHPTNAKWYGDLGVGSYILSVENVRVVQEVWVLTDTGRKKLIKYDNKNFPEETTTKAFDSATQGEPTHYYPTNFRIAYGDNFTDSADIEYFSEHQDTIYTDYDDYEDSVYVDSISDMKGVIVWPPCDETYSFEVVGLYYDVFPYGGCAPGIVEGSEEKPVANTRKRGKVTPVKSVSGDLVGVTFSSYTNYWMAEYPNLLIMAALQQLEYLYKGSKSSARWDDIIEKEIIGIEKDAIEEEVANVTKMLG